MKTIPIIVKSLILAMVFSFTLVAENVTLNQSDVSKMSGEAKKQIAAEKKETRKSAQRKSSNKKSGRERISKRDKRDIKKTARKDAKQERKEIRKKEIAATKSINESKTKTVTVPKKNVPAQEEKKTQKKSADVKKTEPVDDDHWYDFAVFWD